MPRLSHERFLCSANQQWNPESFEPKLRTGTKELSATAVYPEGFARAIAHLHLDNNRQEAGSILRCISKELLAVQYQYSNDNVKSPGLTGRAWAPAGRGHDYRRPERSCASTQLVHGGCTLWCSSAVHVGWFVRKRGSATLGPCPPR